MIRKILIVSDSHGKSKNVKLAINLEKPDMLIHLGDIEDNPDDIRACLDKMAEKWNASHGSVTDRKSMPIPAVFIQGNCDRYRIGGDGNELKQVSVFKLNGHGFYCTHGHREGVNYGLENLYYSALENGCDIALYGHTHRPFDEWSGDVRIMNPGSISLPRGGSRKSYMVMTFKEDGSYEVELKYI